MTTKMKMNSTQTSLRIKNYKHINKSNAKKDINSLELKSIYGEL